MKKHLLKFVFICILIGINGAFAQWPSNGLLGYWAFNGNSNDGTIYENHGVSGHLSFYEDRDGNQLSSAEFAIATSWVEITPLNLGTEFSICFWLSLYSQNNMSTLYTGNNLSIEYESQSFFIQLGQESLEIEAEIPEEEWIHISIIAHEQTLSVYFNGILVGEANHTNQLACSLKEFGGSKGINGGISFGGYLDDVVVYNRVLTQTELSAHYEDSSVEEIIPESGEWQKLGANIFYNEGNVGIGTTSPSSKLQIVTGNNNGISWKYSQTYGESTISNVFDSGSDAGNRMNFNVNNGAGTATNIMTLRGDGNVGIGTTSPGSRLDIASSFGDGYMFDTDFNTDQTKFIFKENNTNIFSFYYDGSASTPNNKLHIKDESYGNNIITFTQQTGNVGIGTTSPVYKLAVAGIIGCGEVIVEDVTGWADFVFEDDYNLMSLKDLDQFIQINKHLPEIPTTAEVEENGISVGEMNAKLLQKIEELTLYVIELKKENEAQNKRIQELENK